MKTFESILKEYSRTLRREWRALRRRRAPWATGIDLDGENVRMIQLWESGGKRRLRGVATVPLRETETNEISEELREILRRWKVEKGRIVTFVPRNRVAVKTVSLPTSDPTQMHRLAPFEASRLLPYPPEELLADVEVFRTREDGVCDATLFAARGREVDEYLALLESLGLEPDKIEVSTTALARVVDCEDSEAIAVCHVSGSRADMVLLTGSEVVFTRGIDLTTAESDDQSLAEEIIRSFRYGRRTDGVGDLGDLSLLVTAKRSTSLVQRLREAFPKQKDWTCERVIAEGIEEDLGPYAAAIGAALEPTGTPNLLPTSLVERRRLRDRIRSGVWISVLACGCLVLGILLADRYLGSLETALEKKTTELRVLSEEAHDLRVIQRRSEAIAEHLNPAGDPLEVYVELYRVVPREIVLNHMHVAGESVVIKGQAHEFPEVWRLVEALLRSPSFDDVQIQFATSHEVKGTNVVDFSLKANLAKSGVR